MLLRVTLLLFFFNAFLVSSKLPDGLLTAKEVGLYCTVALTCLFTLAILLLKKGHQQIQIQLLDLLVFGYLWVIPIIHLIIFDSISISDALIQIAYGFAYLSIRIISIEKDLSTVDSGLTEAIVLILSFQLIIALAQYAGVMPSYYPRFGPTGMFFNPGPFAIFLSALLAYLGVRGVNSLFSRQYLAFSIYIGLMILGSFFVIFSLSRSAWIGLSTGLLISIGCFISIQYKTWLITNRKKIFSICLGLILLLFPIGYWLYNMKSGSADGRILVWLSSIGMISENSFMGVGIGNFAPAYINYQASFLNSSSDRLSTFGSLAGDSRYAFSDLLQIFSEFGLVGFVLFVLIIIQIIVLLLKGLRISSKRIAACCLIGTITVILMAGLTSYPLQMIPIALLFWVFIAVAVSLFGKGLSKTLNKQIPVNILLFVFASASLSYGYYGFLRTKAYLNWMHTEKTEMENEKILKMKRSYSILNDHAEFLFAYAKLYADQGNYSEAVRLLEQTVQHSPAPAFYYLLGNCYEKLGDEEAAKECYQLIRSAIPNLLTPRYLDAKLYLHKMDTANFLVKAQEALDFEPKIHNEKVEKMRVELQSLIKEHKD